MSWDSFFNTLRAELTDPERFTTRPAAHTAILSSLRCFTIVSGYIRLQAIAVRQTSKPFIYLNVSRIHPPPKRDKTSLAFPALMLINAVFLIHYRQFSPGIFTSLILFFPIGIAAYVLAANDQVLFPSTVIISLLIGAGFMIYPILLMQFRDRFSRYK